MKIDLRAISYINGIVICCLAGAMLIPLVYDFFINFGRCFKIFAPAILASVFLGGLIILSCRTNEKLNIKRTDLSLLVVSIWISSAIVCAFPFYVYPGVNLKFASALFEAVSGITTTGATVYQNVEILPRALNLWRFILHFIGGVGIIAIGIVILPIMKIGGMELFQTENSDKSQKFFPKATQTIGFFIWLYVLLIGTIALCLRLSGMPLFDSVCHGISAISTGGFSTKNSGIEFFNSNQIKLIMSIGMFIGGITFLEIIKCFKNGINSFLRNTQTNGYLKLVFFTIFVPIIVETIVNNDITFDGITSHIFLTISAITTTGLDFSDGYMHSDTILATLAVIGSCSGSTTAGIKIFRIQILFAILAAHIKKLSHPYDASMPKYQGKRIDENLTHSVIAYILALTLTFVTSCVLLGLTENASFPEAVRHVTSCLFNLGYGQNFAALHIGSKAILILDMIAGRLEILPMIASLCLLHNRA